MSFLKTSLLNAIAVIIKMLTLLGINKALAVYIGPEGYAAVGQFQNVVQMITTLASGAINTGVTKYTAEHYESTDYQVRIWKTAGAVSVTGSVVCALIIYLFSKDLAVLVLKDSALHSVFKWLAVGLPFFVLNGLLLAILNGKKEIKSYVVANIVGSLISFVCAISLSVSFGLFGALLALAIYQSLAFIITIYICSIQPWFKITYLFGAFDSEILKKLSKFSLMVIVSSIAVPLTMILIRNFLSENISQVYVGQWEALTRLSGAYLMFITTTLSLYFLPRFSEIKQRQELKKEVLKGILFLVPIAILCSSLVYIFRYTVVDILFTKDFYPVAEMLSIQLVGDSLKVISWLLGFLLWAKALVRVFIVTEIIFSISFYLLTIFLFPYFTETAALIGYALNYFFYLLVLSVYFYFWFNKKE